MNSPTNKHLTSMNQNTVTNDNSDSDEQEQHSDVGTGHLRPDATLAKVFSGCVRDVLDEQHGAVKAGTNDALIFYLRNQIPADVLEYNLRRAGYEDLDDLAMAVRNRQNAPFPVDELGGQ